MDQWLQIVKGSGVSSAPAVPVVPPPAEAATTMTVAAPAEVGVAEAKEALVCGPAPEEVAVPEEADGQDEEEDEEEEEEEERAVCIENGESPSGGLVYKITIKDGKQVVAKVPDKPAKRPSLEETEAKGSPDAKPAVKRKLKEEEDEEDEIKKVKSDKAKSKSKVDKSGAGEKKSSRDSSRKSGSSSSRSEVKSDSKSSSRTSDKKHSSSSRNGHSDRSRGEKDRPKESDRDRHKSSKDKLKEKSSKTSDSEHAQAEKDKAILAKLIAPSLSKVGKIPKKSDAAKSEDSKAESKPEVKSPKPVHPAIVPEVKKKSISIEVRKPAEGRPKTVKTFNSKFRSTGLEEEVKPPPPRSAKKAPVAVVAPSVVADKKEHLKRPSPPVELSPAEKKPKVSEPVAVPANKVADKPKRKYG